VAMPAKITLDMAPLGINNYMIPMPAYVEPAGRYGVKWAGGFINNPSQYGLPFVMATLTLNDPKTGIPLAMMDAMEVTDMRTGASTAVAARYLARSDSEVVTFIGCGAQASTSLQALNEVFNVREIRAVDISPKAGERLVEEARDLGIEGRVIEDNEEAVRGADIIVTATTAAEPLVMKDWVAPGTFIGKLGSYQELDDELTLSASKIVVDHREQNEHRGELVHLFEEGRITQEDIYGELGEIVAGTLSGRDQESEVIVAALIGMGTEDVAVGAAVLKRAQELGIGKRFDFLA
jgi:ornithine cyclodeaminase/alanine dehydrogenase-like protein (mu-crystallin family)